MSVAAAGKWKGKAQGHVWGGVLCFVLGGFVGICAIVDWRV